MELSENTLGQSEDQLARELKYMRLEIKECKTQTCSVAPPQKGGNIQSKETRLCGRGA